MSTYAVAYDPWTGAVAGAVRDGTTFIPKNPLNADWQAFTAWADAQTPPVDYTTPGQPVNLTAQVRAAADAELDAIQNWLATVLRALVLVLVDEINALRDRCTSQDSAVAAAASLADLKSRWAALAAAAPLPDRTGQQARSAIKAKVDAGTADA